MPNHVNPHPKNRCPKCGSTKITQSVRHSIWDYSISLVGLYPHDCNHYTCRHHFYARRNKSSSAENAIEQPIAASLYDRVNQERTLHLQFGLITETTTEDELETRLGEPETSVYPAKLGESNRYDFAGLQQLHPRKILTLTWMHNGNHKSHTICSQNRSGSAGRVKLGRNMTQCDVIFADQTVSGVNAEIYFDCQAKNFYLSNLRAINPPFIDHQKIISNAELQSGSTLYLGRVPISVKIEYDYAEIESTLSFDEPTHFFVRTVPRAECTAG